MKRKYNRAAYVFLLPWFVGFVIFTLFPFVCTAYLSLTQVDSTAKGYEVTYIGLENYITAFFKNTEFLPALLSFIAMIVPYTFVITVISFIISILLEQVSKGKEILRIIYFLPVIIMSGPVMQQILDSSSSNLPEGVTIDSYLADSFILQMIQSYSPMLARFISDISSELTVILWFTGIPIVLFISGLKKINPSIYEAARIDAASPWQILFKITIPMLKPLMLVAVIFTISQLGVYEGNPVNSLLTTAMANTSSGLGYAATYAWIYSLVVLLVIELAFLLLKDYSDRR